MNVRKSGIPVTDVYVNGGPLDPDATYNVTVNSYMAGRERLDGQPYSVGLAPAALLSAAGLRRLSSE